METKVIFQSRVYKIKIYIQIIASSTTNQEMGFLRIGLFSNQQEWFLTIFQNLMKTKVLL